MPFLEVYILGFWGVPVCVQELHVDHGAFSFIRICALQLWGKGEWVRF